VPALIVLGIWFLMQLLSGFATPTSTEGGVAVWAHVGGFIAGAILILLFKRRWVEVLEKPRTSPFHIERRRGPWG
jgi:membrane associated rhomboid family serine protease